ncbi:ATP-binding response regulator [Haloarcula salina]|uniref:histidine kinase n=1 Tax=Haloarcula salina TaxID=1429914 RepID=A0AA41G0F5_9EURY|nr:response regulator [Haloarcula salina]MBV0901171.1 response regulator [Haloarcula salina]
MSSINTIRTLVVDDSDFFAEMTADTLTQEHDIDAVAATGASEALDRLESGGFDCVVSDYEMPEMDGLELLDEIRRDNPSIPFILLTGRGDEETASAAIAAGVADYLLKLEVVEDKQYGRLANRIENVVSQDRTRKKFESLVADSPDGIAHLTIDGRILSVNPSMADRLGADADALVDRNLRDVMDAEVADQRIEAGRRVVETGEATRSEDAVGDHHYQNQYIPVDSYRESDTFQLVSRDITDRVERQRKLERQNERLEEFASVVSHDLRNPLNVAQSALDLLDVDGEENADLVGKIDRSLDRMGCIIEDVLTLARQGRTVDDPQEAELETLASTAWNWIEAEQSSLAVESSAELEADRGRVQDLLANLFRNAIEHNDGEVDIEVGLLPDGDAGFYVADDGSGVSEDADEVFEMGYTSSEDGTGFGLAIVEQVAEAHGWSVDLATSAGGGARFEVTGVDLRN